jgi:transcription elongation factor SPT5
MRKFLDRQASGTDELLIKSVQTAGHYKGYIMVEAHKVDHVKHALAGIQFLFLGGLTAYKKIPLNEMVDVMTVKRRELPIQSGMWVRMKRGVYEGDLAKVIVVDENSAKATVMLIPRIDLPGSERARKAEEAQQADRAAGAGARKRKKPERAPLSKITPDDLKDAGQQYETARDGKELYYIWKDNRFRDGMLHKVVAFTAFEYENVVPSLDELQAFMARPTNNRTLEEEGMDDELDKGPGGGGSGMASEADLLPKIDPSSVLRSATSFSKGDLVRVTAGELVNLTGTVESIDKDGQVHITCTTDDLIGEKLFFDIDKLEKFFRVGDHVKVLNGRYKGSTGVVLNVETGTSTVDVMSDLGRSEMKVFAHDLQMSTEYATGLDAAGQYRIYDLVELNAQNVGVIVRIDEAETFKVLDNLGTVRTVGLAEMQGRLTPRNPVALDARQFRMGVADQVTVIDGPFKGRQGTIKHIFRKSVFVLSRTHAENAGIFVVRGHDLRVVQGAPGAATGAPAGGAGFLGGRASNAPFGSDADGALNGSYLRSPGPLNAPGPGGAGGAAGPRGAGGSARAPQDPLVSKLVVITAGPEKGLKARVESANGLMVRVTLLTRIKSMNIERSKVRPVDSLGGPAKFGFVGAGPGGSSSAIHNNGMRTPSFAGSATPMYAIDGDRTPGREGSATPGRIDHDGIFDPNRDFTMPTPRQTQDPWAGPVPTNVPASVQSYGSFDRPTSATPSWAMAGPHSSFLGSTLNPPVSVGGGFGVPGSVAPGTYGGARHQDILSKGVVVRIQDSANEFVVTGNSGSMFSVRPIENVMGTEELNLPADNLEVVRPVRRDKVKVVRGDLVGQTGTLIGIDENDGIVQMQVSEGSDDKGLKIIDLESLVKFHE